MVFFQHAPPSMNGVVFFGMNRPLVPKEAEVTDGFFELPGVPADEDARPTGAALGVVGEGVVEENALPCDLVKCGRLDPLAAVDAGVAELVLFYANV